jgi:hypothetical protein
MGQERRNHRPSHSLTIRTKRRVGCLVVAGPAAPASRAPPHINQKPPICNNLQKLYRFPSDVVKTNMLYAWLLRRAPRRL